MAKSENLSNGDNSCSSPHGLLRVIATDIHFWIPLAVLIGGLMLLNKLR
jgi:hypothetical protein